MKTPNRLMRTRWAHLLLSSVLSLLSLTALSPHTLDTPVASAVAAPLPTASIVNLGSLGGNHSSASDVNDLGQVVGSASTPSGDYHAFLYQNGTMTDLGTLGSTTSYASGINNSGQIVGWSYLAGDEYLMSARAFLYQNGTMTNLGTLGGNTSLARSINNLGQIIGETSHTDNIERQFIYQNGTVTITGTSGSTNLYRNGESYAINDSGHVVGYLDDIRGFLYQNGTKTDLPHLGGHSSLSFPYDINNIGQVVGVSVNPKGYWRAFLYQNGVMTELNPEFSNDDSVLGKPFPSPMSEARGINDLGQIVGNYSFYDSSNNRRQHACLYQNGSMIDLNDLLPPNSGWVLHSANRINNKGQICGYGTHNGLTRAFLMTLPPALVPDGGGGTGNHAPVASDGSVTTNENTSVSVALSATDADGDTLTYSIVSNPTHGSLSGSGANRTYTPAPGYIGGDSFTFKAADPSGAMSNTATVSIAVTLPPPPPNNAPVANDDTLTVEAGAGATAVDVLDNDSDVDGDILTVASVTQPGHGTTTLINGVVRYTPEMAFSGTDSFSYTVSDGQGGTDTATVTVTVQTPSSTSGGKISGNGETNLNTNSVSAAGKGAKQGGATFNFSAANSRKGVTGKLRVHEDRPGMLRTIEATQLTALVVNGKTARLYGTARVNGIGSYTFVLDIFDAAKKGVGADTMSLQLSNGISISGTLQKGNITVQQK